MRIEQTRSTIGCQRSQRETLRTLGLRRIGDVVVREDRPEVRGMLHAVRHLVAVTELGAASGAAAGKTVGEKN